MLHKRRKETKVESDHGHCADVLMSDYGIPRKFRVQTCKEIAKVWKQFTMIHCLIINSVRGWQPNSATRGLEYFLVQHQTHEPKNHNQSHLC